MSAKLILFCALHGHSAPRGRTKCSLSTLARRGWKAAQKKTRDSQRLVLVTAVDDDEPQHGAVCTEDGDDQDWEEAQKELRRVIGRAKAKRTNAQRRARKAQLS